MLLLRIEFTESKLATSAKTTVQAAPSGAVHEVTKPAAKAIIEAEAAVKSAEAYMSRLKDMSRRRPIREFSTDEVMRMTRGED
jgi:hypothetical protein